MNGIKPPEWPGRGILFLAARAPSCCRGARPENLRDRPSPSLSGPHCTARSATESARPRPPRRSRSPWSSRIGAASPRPACPSPPHINEGEMHFRASQNHGQGHRRIDGALRRRFSIDRHEDVLQSNRAALRRNEAHDTAWNKKRHGVSVSGDGFGNGPVHPTGQALALMRGQNDQVRIMIGHITDNGFGWIVSDSLALANQQAGFFQRFPRSSFGQDSPPGQDGPDTGKIAGVGLFRRFIHVQNAQLCPAGKGDADGMRKSHLIASRKNRKDDKPSSAGKSCLASPSKSEAACAVGTLTGFTFD